jgi:hypothetical protein
MLIDEQRYVNNYFTASPLGHQKSKARQQPQFLGTTWLRSDD